MYEQYEQPCEITEFKVQNFKSLKDIKIELKGFNLLVGRNATGKTNIIEAFKLFRDTHRASDFSFFNPFFEWGGYQNVVWRGQEELPIILGYKLQIQDYEVYYEICVTGLGGKFEILRESITIPDIVNITVEGYKILIKHDPEFIEKIWSKKICDELEELATISPIFGDQVSIDKEQLILQEHEVLDRKTLKSYSWSGTYLDDFAILAIHVLTKAKRMPIIISPTVKIKRKIPARSELEGKMKTHVEPLITYAISSVPPPSPIQPMIILRQLNFKAITNPQPVKREIILSEDGSNLANVLHTIYTDRGGIPRRIQRVISSIFGNVEIKPKITEDGRVYIEVYENGYPLNPRVISDGFWKTLTILTAIELKPSIILIDELENSLHPEAIKYIVNELKNSKCIVIASTHSPAVVDIVDPEDLILVEKDEEGKTKVRRIKDAEKVKRWLAKHGITLSEGWLYGEIF